MRSVGVARNAMLNGQSDGGGCDVMGIKKNYLLDGRDSSRAPSMMVQSTHDIHPSTFTERGSIRAPSVTIPLAHETYPEPSTINTPASEAADISAMATVDATIVERLTNSLMMHGRNNGKKLMAIRIVKHAMEVIHLLTDLNPIQVIVEAIINRISRQH